MKIILCDDVKNLGRAGDTVKVADGYGRNYLLPKKLAMIATAPNIKRLEQELNSKKGQARRVQKDAEYQAEAISAKPVLITASAGEGGKLFGSVTSADIEAGLKERGIEVDKRKITMDDQIKMTGSYQVSIKVHADVDAELTVVVQSEEEKAAAEKKEKAEKEVDIVKPVETKVEPVAVEAVPAEAVPAEAVLADAAPAEAVPAEAVPAEAAPAVKGDDTSEQAGADKTETSSA
ncbi:50S ribosomal protein L9 [bacterium]|nr:50S ribosomal protein L9 [bacterium]